MIFNNDLEGDEDSGIGTGSMGSSIMETKTGQLRININIVIVPSYCNDSSSELLGVFGSCVLYIILHNLALFMFTLKTQRVKITGVNITRVMKRVRTTLNFHTRYTHS